MKVTPAATPATRMYPPTRPREPSSGWVRREVRAQVVHFCSYLGGDVVVVDLPQHLCDEARDASHLRFAHTRGGERGGAEADAAGDEGALRIERDGVLVARNSRPIERLLGDLAGDTERAQIDEEQVVVGTARHHPEPFRGEGISERGGVAHNGLGVAAKRG